MRTRVSQRLGLYAVGRSNICVINMITVAVRPHPDVIMAPRHLKNGTALIGATLEAARYVMRMNTLFDIPFIRLVKDLFSTIFQGVVV